MTWVPIAFLLILIAVPTAIPAAYLIFRRLAKEPQGSDRLVAKLPARWQEFAMHHRTRLTLGLSAASLIFAGVIIWLVLPFSGLPEAIMILAALLIALELAVISTWAWRQTRRLVKNMPPPSLGTPGEFIRLWESDYLEEIGKKYFGGSVLRIVVWEAIMLAVYAVVGLFAVIMFWR